MKYSKIKISEFNKIKYIIFNYINNKLYKIFLINEHF